MVGYCTLYNFFSYPAHTRTRLSQILILPPYQGMGIGSLMLQAANAACMQDPQCLELTYEDPTDDLNRIRDLIDCRRLMGSGWFLGELREAVVRAQQALTGPNGVQEAARCLALPPSVTFRARSEFRICPLQCARVWEQCLYSTHEVRQGASDGPSLRLAAISAAARRMKCDEEQRKQQIAKGE